MYLSSLPLLCHLLGEYLVHVYGNNIIASLIIFLSFQIKQLKQYSGARFDLGQAEQFILMLADIPDYRTLLNALAFKTEFKAKFEKLRSAFQAMIHASKNVLHHPGLKDFLGVVLEAGNFLNSVSIIIDQYLLSCGYSESKFNMLECSRYLKYCFTFF